MGRAYLCPMDYFELFGIPVQFFPDTKALTRTYVGLQKKYHPDFYGQGSDEEKREAEEMSSLVNKAYRTLKDKDLTMQYVLTQKGCLQEGENYKLPPDFLMEVMDLNEMKMDGADAGAIAASANTLLQQMETEVMPLLEGYNNATITAEQLESIKEFYFKKKYIDRLLAE